MAAIERVIPLVSHLPQSIRDALARRLRELIGLGLIALSGVRVGGADDLVGAGPVPQPRHLAPIRNILGYPGAIGADLLMQILGLGAIMLILPIAVWGWRMLTHRTFDREALRLGCWMLCTVIAAGFASCWAMAAPGRCRPASAAWSATRWCARRRSCSARPASSIGLCSAPSCSPRCVRPSCSPPAGARVRAKTRS